MRHRSLALILGMVLCLAIPGLVACDGDGAATQDDPTGSEVATETLAPVRIGTLPTEDSLPLWVAEDSGYFEQVGLGDVEIVVFQSAQERDAALTSGAIDGFMGDIIASANLEAGGTPVTIATIMLGGTAEQGRFGVVASPASTLTDASELAGVQVGTSSATIQEYVLDGLANEAGVDPDDVDKEEVKKVPVRFELLMQDKLEAAALPEPFLSLAEKQGAALLADDTSGDNLSQTVLVFTDEYYAVEGGVEAVEALLAAWDRAAGDINEDPDAYRALLIEKTRMPGPLQDSYEINTYPTHDVPTSAQVDAVLDWMRDRGYLKETVTYEDLVIVTP